MIKVLIVDDEPANRYLVAAVLSQGEFHVLEAATAEEGLDMLREHHPDLAIVDLYLPRMSGAAFIRAVRSEPAIASTNLALYTGSSIDDAMRDFMAMVRVRHVIPKPSEPDELLRIVREALASN